MNIISTITLSKTIHKDINASIISILLSKLKTQTLFKYVSKFIPIPKHYNTLLNTIEENMKENNLGMANLTIEYNNINNNNNSNSIIINNKKTKKSKQTKSTQTKSKHTKSKHTKSKHTNQINTIHQLFIIPINDLLYNKKDDSELLELARVSGNAMFID